MARPKINPDTVKMMCPTCNDEFEVKFYDRKRRTFCSKKCSSNNEIIKEKNRVGVKKTFDEKYGMHPMKTEQGKQNLKNSVLVKYGVDWISKKDGWFDTVKKNNLMKYGVEIYTNSKKANTTRLGRDKAYTDEIQKRRKFTKYKNHYNYLINFFNINKLKFICEFDDYKGYHFDNKYNFECLDCNRIFVDTIDHPERVFCNCCHPEKKDTLEERFYKVLTEILPKEITVKRRDRTILLGKELDFYIPQKNVAFELNGLYWHSEIGGDVKQNYHLNKTKACSCHGIKLVHITENEWNYKENIIKSEMKKALNIEFTNTINANECDVKEVVFKDRIKFLNENHLDGEDKSTIALGLYSDTMLISIMTFKLIKNDNWELVRFCNKLDTAVIGGASKLFSHFVNNYKFKQMVSYSDRRYFGGDIYNTLGFKFVGYTPPNYHYIVNNYKDLKHRMSFQKHKLPKLLKEYDEKLSEWDNMKNNGYDRIWDCGNSKFLFVNPH